MSVELPPLPEPVRNRFGILLFGGDQMRAYARAAVDAALEAERARCLRVVKMRSSEDRTPQDMAYCIGVSIADGYDPDSPAALAIAG